MSLAVFGVVYWREKSDSSAGKRTWDLSIRLPVLYLLNYWRIHASPSKQQSLSSDYIYIYVHQPSGSDLTCGRRFCLQ